jgi:hypothetical protein
MSFVSSFVRVVRLKAVVVMGCGPKSKGFQLTAENA